MSTFITYVRRDCAHATALRAVNGCWWCATCMRFIGEADGGAA